MIKYKVYITSEELVRELEGYDWGISCKVIVNLYQEEEEADGVEDPENLLSFDLRPMYWKMLMSGFEMDQEMPGQNVQFDELRKSPLMLFGVGWTIRHAGIQLDQVKNMADLYEKIFRYIYTREYNRESEKSIYFKSREYSEYQQMLKAVIR